ncbi:MAG: rhodanese-like domain-containing protein, partial [Thermoplasmata archaeon]|nr:rhodanese-like domain-containing protein [Thermoplasmata archaeon]
YEASSDEWETLRQAAEMYANEATLTITAEAVYNNLNDGYTANDPFILSVRGAEHYNNGHIPGAVNIGTEVLLEEDNLALLPTDKQIVVYCYTGQGAGHVSAMLNINGFDVISLQYGMCSWTDDPAIHMDKCYTSAGDYQIYVGEDQGDWV